MEELRIETTAGNFPLEQEIVRKYGLKMGTLSPFTSSRIAGRDGEYPQEKRREAADKDAFRQHSQEELGGKAEDGVMLTASERIDFALGNDSDEE